MSANTYRRSESSVSDTLQYHINENMLAGHLHDKEIKK